MIDNNKWYTVREIEQGNLLPFLGTAYKIKKWIEKGYLKGNIIGTGNAKRYYVKGSNLINFIAKWESGDFHS